MALRNLFSKKLPSLEEKNNKFREVKDEDELTEEDLEKINGNMTREEWEALQKAKEEAREKESQVIRR